MPIDINLLRPEKGGNPDIVRESQRRRFANVEQVDVVMDLDKVCSIQLIYSNGEKQCFSLIN